MKLYTDSFYQKISYDIDTICEKNSKLTFLTPEQFKKQSSIVEEFIREKCLKIYGGVAINIHLPEDDKIYQNINKNSNKIIDYDVYTISPKSHATELGNLLFKAGFEYVNVQEGVNKGVYKVFNYFQEVVDLVYIPERIYNLLPHCEYNGLRYVSPKHLKIDLLVALTNPKYSTFRWKKDYERLTLIEKNFPHEKPKKFLQNNTYKKQPYYLDKIIRDFINKRDDYVIFGDLAYTAFMEKSKLEDYYKPQVKYIEIGLTKPLDAIKELKVICKNNIRVKRYNPFLKHIPARYIVTPRDHSNTIILIIYDLSDKIIPYVTINNQKVQSYHSLLLFYNFMIYLSACYNIHFQKDSAECCLYELERARKYYFTQNNENQFTENVFKSFIYTYTGEEKNIYRDSKINAYNRTKKFFYTPGKRQFLVESNKVGTGSIKFISGEYDKEI